MTKKSTPQQTARIMEIVRMVLTALNLTREALQRVITNIAFPRRLGEFIRSFASEYFVLLTDEEAVDWLVKRAKKLAEARQIVDGWRQQARAYGIADTVLLHALVHPGCTFKHHIPKLGPCRKDFQYLQDWNFPDDPTEHALVSWVPTPLRDSTSKNVTGQTELVSAFKTEVQLPAWYQVTFGSVTHVAGLILAHSKAANQDPFNGLIVRTDSCRADGFRLYLRRSGGLLSCGDWHWDDGRNPGIAVFAVGVVKALGR